MNTKTGLLTKGYNSYSWKFQQTIEDLTNDNYKNINIVYEKFQHLFNVNFGVIVREHFKNLLRGPRFFNMHDGPPDTYRLELLA
jgi:hypothetical protein